MQTNTILNKIIIAHKSDNKNITEFEISKVVAGCQPFLWIDNPIQLHHTTKKLA